MRFLSSPERRVLLLQRAAVIMSGPRDSVTYLHTYDPVLGTTPAAAAWGGGDVARRAAERLRSLALADHSDAEVAPAHCPDGNSFQTAVSELSGTAFVRPLR
jgi:hypothetical protein